MKKIKNGFKSIPSCKEEIKLILGGIKFRKGYGIYVVRISAILYLLIFLIS